MLAEHLEITIQDRPTPGGQSVGMPSLGVQVKHLPTGLIAYCDCARSQQKNKNIAIAMLEYGLAELGLHR